MNDDCIYLDHNATTPLLPRVLEAMLPYLQHHFGNPSSEHPFGRRAKQGVEQARLQVAALLGAEPEEVYFTSGGTEANNLAIRGCVDPSRGQRLLSTTVEHPATMQACTELAIAGAELELLEVDDAGWVDMDALRSSLQKPTALLTVILAQNETGVLFPVAEMAREARASGALVHTDAAQAVGKIETRVKELGVDLLSVAGHKLYAPKGVGALYVRRGVRLRPLLVGAGHERGLRPGTENVASIVGLGEACAAAAEGLEHEAARVRGLRDRLWEGLHCAVPGLCLNGHPEERLPNTLNVSFPDVLGSDMLAATPEIAASTGSACHAGVASASAVLSAMGLTRKRALGAVRLSLGRETSAEQVERAISLLAAAWRQLSSA
ncbi:MAG: cysteine desulfurase family protein [Myxococcota bacterium]|jgi:cysteine desulfurase|nr:cysteine desulfurase family protein [Myxococcota bacterium]